MENSNNNAQAAKPGWNRIGGYWYYYVGSSPLKNQWYKGYFLKKDGKMARNEWYFDKIDNSWYYLTDEGSYARDTWIGDYYLESDGKLAHDRVVDGFYINFRGDIDLVHIGNNKWYHLSGYWYYKKGNGKFAYSEWVGDYYVNLPFPFL